MYSEITKCRVCGGGKLKSVLNLGEQSLTGVFPKSKSENISVGPLELVLCQDCYLLQMKQSYDLGEMYGDNYGYRSGLNESMVKHLRDKIHGLELFVRPSDEDLVVDIGSNDATSLKAYKGKYQKIGIDPTGLKFESYYPPEISLISDFFQRLYLASTIQEKKSRF